jgi:hypothetical protein
MIDDQDPTFLMQEDPPKPDLPKPKGHKAEFSLDTSWGYPRVINPNPKMKIPLYKWILKWLLDKWNR